MITKEELKEIQRQRLYKSFKLLRRKTPFYPYSGWIKTIREALLMPRIYLANKLSMDESSIARLEESEKNKTITISSLEKLAEALECELVYMLIPKKLLSKMLIERAKEKMKKSRLAAENTMALEGQKIKSSKSLKNDIFKENFFADLIKYGKLWS